MDLDCTAIDAGNQKIFFTRLATHLTHLKHPLNHATMTKVNALDGDGMMYLLMTVIQNISALSII